MERGVFFLLFPFFNIAGGLLFSSQVTYFDDDCVIMKNYPAGNCIALEQQFFVLYFIFLSWQYLVRRSDIMQSLALFWHSFEETLVAVGSVLSSQPPLLATKQYITKRGVAHSTCEVRNYQPIAGGKCEPNARSKPLSNYIRHFWMRGLYSNNSV